MRNAFHQQLDDLIVSIAEMCGAAGEAMESATQALLQADLVLAEQVITNHALIVQKTRKTEEQALTVLALQAPVAGDLRAVVSALKNIADVDRMAALALHVAKLTRRRHPEHVLPEEVNGYFTEMGRIAVDMGSNVKQVVLSKDAHRAEQLADDDDDMDNLHRHLFSVLMNREWRHGVAAAVDVTLLGRYYERFADHAVEIGRRVIFSATGESV
ncbi:phosphate transport system regulatory protein PhoU [Mycolicibacterium moriokaense]|uniref:Phosphate-specific transport system accessory protein PhoU n=1 Tax=Mycolicibacterium moriokaense TaxID=39691 RepID=A0AAD1HFQ4_9MYCO|nr:phosphate signaling complex protein PhoU [Mycolicibacterium moriokaense]MCV7039299.1 phosphate signaling complex protein PhoU [Mycolicibacterium moriokaense]ORB26862.1 phosphate transport system regulatory protein PhoU [Mycolicibacterium moriokaense]BBX03819.1 phosphate transport system regulatory protein PhoU [Mycolicibacterium moriokaense]